VTNNPILMSDPSGQIAPFLAAAGLGGLIGAGMNVFSQLHAMQPQSLEQALRCLDWGQVGISFASGAIAGLTGFLLFGGMTAWLGTGLMANIASGAIAGAISGQYARLTGLILSGQASQIGSGLFRPEDLFLDTFLGGAFAGVGYGLGRLLGSVGSRLGAACANSFNAETEVATDEGEKDIEEIKVGDLVLAYDELNGETGYYTVTGIISHLDPTVVSLTIDSETLTTTLEHPFFTEEEGWQKVGELKIGDHVRKADGSFGQVQSFRIVDDPQWMFNLTVDQAHTFFVGEEEWLVHNDCGVAEWEVGRFKDLHSRSNPGDGYQIHHAPQFQPANQVIPHYSYQNGPAIILRDGNHFDINNFNVRGSYNYTAQELLSKTLSDLRSVGAPESALGQLQDLWRSTWPFLFK